MRILKTNICLDLFSIKRIVKVCKLWILNLYLNQFHRYIIPHYLSIISLHNIFCDKNMLHQTCSITKLFISINDSNNLSSRYHLPRSKQTRITLGNSKTIIAHHASPHKPHYRRDLLLVHSAKPTSPLTASRQRPHPLPENPRARRQQWATNSLPQLYTLLSRPNLDFSSLLRATKKKKRAAPSRFSLSRVPYYRNGSPAPLLQRTFPRTAGSSGGRPRCAPDDIPAARAEISPRDTRVRARRLEELREWLSPRVV